jgi:uncharacterized protein
MPLIMVPMRVIKGAVRKIAERFRPARITLFGSYAYGKPNQHSDVDLLVLMNDKRGCDWALRIRQEIDFGFPLDLLVRSPAVFLRRIKWGDYFLIEIQVKGKVLYESPDARVGDQGRRRLRNGAARGARSKVADSSKASELMP